MTTAHLAITATTLAISAAAAIPGRGWPKIKLTVNSLRSNLPSMAFAPLARLLITYQDKYGLCTIEGIITPLGAGH